MYILALEQNHLHIANASLPSPQAAAEVSEEPASFITVFTPLPEEEVPEPSPTLGRLVAN